jgi:hypothetical protein
MSRHTYTLLLCLTFAGCPTKVIQPAPVPVEPKPDNLPRVKKLLASTDLLIIKHFFPPTKIVDPKKGEFLSAGSCEFEPVTVFEPQKEAERLKGIRIEISSTYVRENAYSKAEKGVSFLDIDEARDLENAFSYTGRTEEDWLKQHPADDLEVTFTSKDDFTAVMLPGPNGDILLLQSGRIGSAAVYLPVSLLGEAAAKLRSALSTLDAN